MQQAAFFSHGKSRVLPTDPLFTLQIALTRIRNKPRLISAARNNFARNLRKIPTHSLRSKRFRLVSEQRKTEERDSRFWPREK